MAYYNRPKYLERTLALYYEVHEHKLKDVEFVIVDDGSEDDHRASKIIKKFDNKMDIRLFYRENKNDINPAVAINTSVMLAKNNRVIITCPEIFPATPYLHHIPKYIFKNDYYLIPCYSISQERQKTLESFSEYSEINNILPHMVTRPVAIKHDGDDGWYSHEFFRPVWFYFTAMIRKDFFFTLGGIDEDFRYGWGYEDTDFVERLKKSDPYIFWMNNDYCIHQNHYDNKNASRPDKVKIEGRSRNRALFEQKNNIKL